jgi:hypothetical protein
MEGGSGENVMAESFVAKSFFKNCICLREIVYLRRALPRLTFFNQRAGERLEIERSRGKLII